MAIDTGIYANLLRPPKSVAEYDQEAQASQLNALQLQQGRMKQDEYQRGIADQNALRDATRGFGADTTANYNALLRTGNMKAAQDYQKSNADIAKTRGEMGKDAAQTAKYNGEVMDATLQRYRGALDTIADPQSAARWLQAQYQDPVIGGFMAGKGGSFEEAVRSIPTDPEGFAKWRGQAGMGMEKFIAEQRLQAGQAEQKRQFGITSGQTAANDIMTPDGKGGYMPNTPLIGAKAAIAKSGASSVSVNTGQKGFDNTLKMRSEFRNEPIYKAHQEMQSAHSQITQSLKQASPAGDLAGATKLMKLLDPGSVVRESELGMAMAASGLMDRVQNYAQNVVNGTKLTPTQRADFQKLGDALFGESVKHFNAKRGEYQGIAERNGLPIRDVIGDESAAPAKPAANGGWSITPVKP